MKETRYKANLKQPYGLHDCKIDRMEIADGNLTKNAPVRIAFPSSNLSEGRRNSEADSASPIKRAEQYAREVRREARRPCCEGMQSHRSYYMSP